MGESTGVIGAIILFIFFVINWFVWLASWVNTVASAAVASGNLTGVEAFFFSNLNFIILISMFLGMLGFMYFGSNQA